MTNLNRALKIKKDNITKVVTFDIEGVSIEIDSINKRLENNNKIIKLTNSELSNSGKEKLALKKKLCNSYRNKIISDNEDNIVAFNQNIRMIKSLEAEIKKLESDSKILKKDIIADELDFLIKYFFKDKYVFNKETFSISFMNTDVTNELDLILSEGEKGLIVFCYYIASTNSLVENNSEYDKIFYIIDDPISSMDFQYVYSVAKIINDYCYKKTKNKSPVLIFTHSLEFFSILMRNSLVEKGFRLYKGELKDVDKNLLVPYEEHLRDVYNVSIASGNPSHTTPNSMRYILETINKFKDPECKLDDFIAEEQILKKSSALIKIMHSFSHGEIRNEPSYVEEDIVDGCESIIEYITKNYKGQIKRVKEC